MSRLTDEELTHLEMFGANDVPSRMSRRIWSLIKEIRERRAADLSDEEREALDWGCSRIELAKKAPHSALNREFNADCDRALSVLDRLLSHAGGDK